MKQCKWIALALAILVCLTACGKTTPAPNEPDYEPEIIASPAPDSGIPSATTTEEPTLNGETYQTSGMFLGLADNNLLVIIEANPSDGKPEKSFQISPDIDLEQMGIEPETMVDITYTVDEHGVKRVQTIAVKY